MRQLLRCLLLLAPLPFAACDCEPPPVDPPREGWCTRLDDVEDRRCNRDEQCSCGTHCDLGHCVAAGAATSGCGDGENCDDF